VFAGLLSTPKGYASRGTVAGGPLAPTFTIPNETTGRLFQMGSINVNLTTSGNVGDDIHFSQTTGELVAVAPGASPAVGFSAIPLAKLTEFNLSAPGQAVVELT
jgi:hypothetical protein